MALICLFLTGCGAADEIPESSLQPQEKGPYHLAAEEWKAYGEVQDSDSAWSALGYWDDLVLGAAAAGRERTERYTAAEGQNFYVLVCDRETGEQGERFYNLTQVDMESLKAKRTELKLSDAGGMTAEEAAELTVLTEAMEGGQAELAGLDVLEGRPCLFFCLWENGELAGMYSLQLGENGRPEGMTDLLPGLVQAGTALNRRPTDFTRDSRGNYYVIDNGEGGQVCVLNERGEFLTRIGAPGKPDSIVRCTGKLPEGSPVFEVCDQETEVLIILCFDGEGGKILYRGQGTAAKVRYFSESGEMIWLENGGILRWNAAKGSCQRFYRDNGWEAFDCEAVWENGEGEITVVCQENGVTSLSRLAQGAEAMEQLRIFAFMGGDAWKDWKEYAAEYCRRHPGTEITVEAGEPGSDGGVVMNRIMAQLLSGKGPDVLIMNGIQLETFQEKGVLAELSDLIPGETREQIFGCVLRQGSIGEELYGIADQVTVSTLLVSKKVWAGKSWSAREVLELLEERERRGEPVERWISQGSPLTADHMLYNLVLLDVGEDGSWPVDLKQRKCFFDTPEFIRLLEACKKYGEAPEVGGSLSEEERLAELSAGKALAFPAEGDLKGFSHAMTLCGEGYHCVGYPVDSGSGSRVSCYSFAAMNAETKHYELAADFLKDIWSAETQKGLGTSTVRRDLLTAGVADRHPANDDGPVFLIGERNVILLDGKADGSSWLPEYMELLDQGKPASWWSTELQGMILEEAAAFFAGDRSASATAQILQNRIQNYLDERR